MQFQQHFAVPEVQIHEFTIGIQSNDMFIILLTIRLYEPFSLETMHLIIASSSHRKIEVNKMQRARKSFTTKYFLFSNLHEVCSLTA